MLSKGSSDRAMLGMDAGSRFVKMAWTLAGSEKPLEPASIYFHTIDTAEFYREWVTPARKGLMIRSEKFAHLLGDLEFSAIGVTGYGRNVLDFSGGHVINEIKAHALGASILSGLPDFLLLDIGGQDTKVILVENGRPVDFATNDKCAAGCGRYLEHMASILGVSLEELSRAVEAPENLSSTCAIFAESEVIGLMASGKALTSIMAGVNSSAAQRIYPLLEPFLANTSRFLLSGGGSRNSGISHFLAELCGLIPQALEPGQFCGAIGALERARRAAAAE